MDDWATRRMAELIAAAPARRKSKKEAFVKVPLWWAEQAAQATGTPKAMVWVWLLHLAWKARSNTFPLPNGQLHHRGVGRNTKLRTLRELERAGLIQITWRRGKSPIVALLHV